TEALLYMMRHDHIDPLLHVQELGEFAGYSIRAATAAFLARPGENENVEAARMILDKMAHEEGTSGRLARLEAARLIGSLPDRFEVQLFQLLRDPDTEVLQYAIRSAGALRKLGAVPTLIEHLGNPDVRGEATDALLMFQGAIAGTLRDYL